MASAGDNLGTGARRILLVEDEAVNRELLAAVLEDQYEVICTEDSASALEKIDEGRGGLSLILLDLNLPDWRGTDLLKKLREDGILSEVPVIVLTADREAEVESLTMGAMDFISKPYPRPEVILARVRRTLELFEGRGLPGQSERDPLTGLLSPEHFFRAADEYDAAHPDVDMDAVTININHFHMINERYGKVYGDEVLRRVSGKVLAAAQRDGGIAGRRDADTFTLYRPHRSDYTDLLDAISEGAAGEGKAENIVRLRMGVYPRADRSIDIERRFDRAKLAADTVRSTFTKAVAIYDSALHESAIFAEQLLIDFPRALEERQFLVYYQPKYGIRGEHPVLNSAEALVRWEHPEFGMISPGIFIPLLEKNGLIQQLDSYVWRAAAAQMRDWRDRLGFSVPVSVNVSRVDMFDPLLVDQIKDLVWEFRLEERELMLEVTESAYTEDSDHIIRTVEHFRSMGFFIEMDDFGSGYSSLNMLSDLPIDALKLDMQFIRSAFKNGKNTRMLEIVIEIADSLSVPVIAEGVETAEQLFTLKAMGCDIVQGFYFSRPLPAEKFEAFLLEKKAGRGHSIDREKEARIKAAEQFTYEAMHDPLTGLYNHSAYKMLLKDADQRNIALLLADVDGFKAIVSEHGPETGNRLLELVADVLKHNFRSVDFICRIGEDEFAVIMTRMNRDLAELVNNKAQRINAMLTEQSGDLPPVGLSIGVAFADRDDPQGDIFHDADIALQRMKQLKQAGCAIF